MKKVFALLLTLAMVLSLAACGGNSSGNSGSGSGSSGDKVIKIGVFEPASGDSASGGKKETLGMEYANSETSTVEIGGEVYNIQLVRADNGSTTDKAPSAAADLVA